MAYILIKVSVYIHVC